MDTCNMNTKEQRKLEILRILREGTLNTQRADGDWNLEAFLVHFGHSDRHIIVEALEELIKENAIYVDNLGLFRKANIT